MTGLRKVANLNLRTALRDLQGHCPSPAAAGHKHSSGFVRGWSSKKEEEGESGLMRGAALKGDKADIAIIGGGIVGLATAREIVSRFPKSTVVVLEKDKKLVPHQTSHNSGVIHAGIYYEPGSDMATLCVEGGKRMYDYCEKKNLPCKRVGKLIVATRESEIPILHDLHATAKANKVQGLEILNSRQILDLEPNVKALQALHSPNTGITDYAKVGLSYAEEFLQSGRGQIRCGYAA